MKLLLVTCDEDKHSKKYFLSKEDFDKYAYVFKDHWCHIHFHEQDFEEITDDEIIKQAKRDPKERAESELSWGFANENNHGFTPEEAAFLKSFEREQVKKQEALSKKHLYPQEGNYDN